MKRVLPILLIIGVVAMGIVFRTDALSSLLKDESLPISSPSSFGVEYSSTNLGFMLEEISGSAINYKQNGEIVGECIFIHPDDLALACEKLGLVITNRYSVGDRDIIEGVSPVTKFSLPVRQANIQICKMADKVTIASPIIYGSY